MTLETEDDIRLQFPDLDPTSLDWDEVAKFRVWCFNLIKRLPELAYNLLEDRINECIGYETSPAQWRREFMRYYTWLTVTYPKGVEAATIAEIEGEARSAVGEIIDDLGNEVSGAYQDALGGVREITSFTVEHVKDLVRNVQDFAVFAKAEVGRVYEKFRESLSDNIELLVNYIDPYVKNAINATKEIGDTALEETRAFASTALSKITESSTRALEYVRDLHSESMGDVRTVSLMTMQAVGEAQDDLKSDTSQVIARLGTAGVRSETSISELVSFLTDDIVPNLGLVAAAQGMPLGIPDNPESQGMLKALRDKIFSILKVVNDSIYDAQFDITETAPDTLYETVLGGVLSILMTTISTGLHVVQSLQISNASRSQRFLNSVLSHDPQQPLSPSEAAELNARKLIDETFAREEALSGGLNNERVNALFEGAHKELDIQALYAAYHRAYIDDNKFIEKMGRLGYRDDDVNILYALRLVRPGVQDLITMAVREVFSEDIADQFELFSDLPEEFIKQAGEQGLSEEWAKRYWGAHWQLPSANQGFEMFHRGFIDRETLKLLLRALDYSPFWRENLENIAYQPITRVDIRRLYKLGLIDEEEVERRHRDIGYNPEDAVLMTKFTKAYSGGDVDDDSLDLTELTRTQIKKLWGLGTFNDNTARDALVSLGYNTETAKLLVDSWQDEEDIAYRDALINKYSRRAIRESMSNLEIEALFSDLDLTSDEMVKVKRLIRIEIEEYDSIPTKAELRSMYSGGIIDYDTWFDYMRKLGYTEFWITNYRKLWSL